MAASFASLQQIRLGKQADDLRTERDIPINYVLISVFILLIPIFLMISCAIIPDDAGISSSTSLCHFCCSTFYILIGGFVFCSIVAYFAGSSWFNQ